MILHNVIIILFVLLIVCHLYKVLNPVSIIEGATSYTGTYTNPNLDNDPTYLARINAANITYLKEQIDSIGNLRQQIVDVSGVVHTNSDNIKEFGKQMSNNLNMMKHQITGATSNVSGGSTNTTGASATTTGSLPQATGLN